jgi:hypothetical protein
LNGMYPAKSLSRFADIIALCVQVKFFKWCNIKTKIRAANLFYYLLPRNLAHLSFVSICLFALFFYNTLSHVATTLKYWIQYSDLIYHNL